MGGADRDATGENRIVARHLVVAEFDLDTTSEKATLCWIGNLVQPTVLHTPRLIHAFAQQPYDVGFEESALTLREYVDPQ